MLLPVSSSHSYTTHIGSHREKAAASLLPCSHTHTLPPSYSYVILSLDSHESSVRPYTEPSFSHTQLPCTRSSLSLLIKLLSYNIIVADLVLIPIPSAAKDHYTPSDRTKPIILEAPTFEFNSLRE